MKATGGTVFKRHTSALDRPGGTLSLRPLQTEVVVGKAPVVVGSGVQRVEANGLVVVLYRTLVLTEVVVGQAPVVVGDGELRVEANGLVPVFYRTLVLTKVAVFDAPFVVVLSGGLTRKSRRKS